VFDDIQANAAAAYRQGPGPVMMAMTVMVNRTWRQGREQDS
jgi:hypothetical protein